MYSNYYSFLYCTPISCIYLRMYSMYIKMKIIFHYNIVIQLNYRQIITNLINVKVSTHCKLITFYYYILYYLITK